MDPIRSANTTAAAGAAATHVGDVKTEAPNGRGENIINQTLILSSGKNDNRV